MEKIKVVIIVNELLRGGAQRMILDAVQNYSRDTFDILVVTLKACADHGSGEETIRAEVEAGGTRVVEINGGQRFSFSEFYRLFRFLKEEKPDIVHTYLPYAGTIGRVAGRLSGVKAIISTQCNLPSAYSKKVYWLDLLTLPLAHKWTAATEGIESEYGKTVAYVSENLLREGRRHFSVVAGVNLEKLQKLKDGFDRVAKRTELGLTDTDIAVMMTARLISWKGHAHFVDAIQYVPKNVKVFFVGWGPLEKQLKKQRDDLGLTEQIAFLGSRNDVPELLLAMDIYAQTHVKSADGKIWVGPNTAQMEACAAGVPSISSAVPQVDFLIQDKITGLLYTPGDSSALAKAIVYMVEHKEKALKMAFEARKVVESKYTARAMTCAYELLYAYMAQKN